MGSVSQALAKEPLTVMASGEGESVSLGVWSLEINHAPGEYPTPHEHVSSTDRLLMGCLKHKNMKLGGEVKGGPGRS